MKERPILFGGSMVQAILNGRKSQTRRVIKPQPLVNLGGDYWWKGGYYGHNWDALLTKCPFQVGQTLWIRETFLDGLGVGGYAPEVDPDTNPDGPTIDVIYRADDPQLLVSHWKPSIFMPKKHARIWLEITEVRVEMLNAITLRDIEAEGISDDRATYNAPIQLSKFQVLWDSIHDKGWRKPFQEDHPYNWGKNPWVWVVSFKRIS